MKSANASEVVEQQFESLVGAGQAALSQFADVADEVMSAGYGSVEESTKAQMQGLKDAQSQTKNLLNDQVKVLEQVSKAAVSNTEGFYKTVTGYAKTNTAQNLAAMRRMAQAKDPAEFSAIQLEAVTGAGQRFMEQFLGLSKFAGDAMQKAAEPVTGYVEKSMEKAKPAK